MYLYVVYLCIYLYLRYPTSNWATYQADNIRPIRSRRDFPFALPHFFSSFFFPYPLSNYTVIKNLKMLIGLCGGQQIIVANQSLTPHRIN